MVYLLFNRDVLQFHGNNLFRLSHHDNLFFLHWNVIDYMLNLIVIGIGPLNRVIVELFLVIYIFLVIRHVL